MRHAPARGAVMAWALSLTVTVVQSEDLTIIATVKKGKGDPVVFTQYFTPGRARECLEGDADVIRDLSSGVFTVIERSTKRYWQSSHRDFVTIGHQVEKQIEAMRPLVPKQEGKRAELAAQLLSAWQGGPEPLRKGNTPRRVAGYDCNHHVLSAPKIMLEIWATTAIQPPDGYFDAMKGYLLSDFFSKSAKDAAYKELEKIQGLPLAFAWSVVGGQRIFELEATEVKLGPIATSTFDPPSGYEQAESPFEKMIGTLALDASLGPSCETLLAGKRATPSLASRLHVMKAGAVVESFLKSVPRDVPLSVKNDLSLLSLSGAANPYAPVWYSASEILEAVAREWKPTSDTLICIRETSSQVGRWVMKGTPDRSWPAYEVVWEVSALQAGHAKAHKKTLSSYPPAETDVLVLTMKGAAPEGKPVEAIMTAVEPPPTEPPLGKLIDWLRRSERQ